ncbi:MAG: hypothetical protein IPM54_13465 [Polyangiaceae bacterium]|nr:hypothetical protein [Polyangiaceae bacterium]
MHSRFQRLGFAVLAGPMLLVTSAMVGALSSVSCTSTTAEKRVVLNTRIVADDAIDAPVVNAYGWSVVLTRAALSIGPLYYWNGAPAFAEWKPRDDSAKSSPSQWRITGSVEPFRKARITYGIW